MTHSLIRRKGGALITCPVDTLARIDMQGESQNCSTVGNAHEELDLLEGSEGRS